MRADLHTHTTASDGRMSPTELVTHAAELGLDAIAVTDHDTVAGVDAAMATGERDGVRVVPGIELSSRDGDRNVHILGYFIEHRAPWLGARLLDRAEERLDRAHRMVLRLNELGYAIELEDVREQAGTGVIARPHVARALVALGHIPDVASAFTPELIADGGRADVPRTVLEADEAVRLVCQANGVPVIAHPGLQHHRGDALGDPGGLVARLVDVGLQGIEVDHPEQDASTRQTLRELAERFDLVPTGGSDFHGEEDRPLGRCVTEAEAFDRLESLAPSADPQGG